MKITNFETFLLRLPVSSGAEAASGPTEWPTFDYVLLRIDTEDGPSGWGDGFGYWVPQATRAVLDHTVGPRLIGRDARDISGIARSLQQELHLSGRYGITMFAFSAVDIALWDIVGKAAGVPVVTGDTKVVERGKGDGVFITTTGVGVVPDGVEISGAQPLEAFKQIIDAELAALEARMEAAGVQSAYVTELRAVLDRIRKSVD